MHRVLDPKSADPRARGRCALSVMTKAPRAGRVKTRLVPPLTHGEAAQLNTCFLRDTAAAIASVCSGALGAPSSATAVAVYTPVGAEGDYVDILPSNFELVSQRGDAFGDRLAFAVEDLFKIGFASVCLIDSDSPTVTAEMYSDAVRELARAGDRIVIGPSDDGGYYLIGLKRFHRGIFEGIDWSTERVLEQTKRRATELNLEIKLLPPGYDVDDGVTLRRLCGELLDTKSAPTFDRAPSTTAFLRELVARGGGDRIWHGDM
jgi:rSAM/selenodomain-associated transferase 1